MGPSERARSLLRRASNHDLPFSAFQAIKELREELHRLEATAIQSARSKGATWDEIASGLGVSRQALHQRMRRAAAGPKPRGRTGSAA